MSKWFLLAFLLAPNVVMAQQQSFPEMCPDTSQEFQMYLSRFASPGWAGKDACFWAEQVMKRLSDKLAQKEGCTCGLKKKRA